MFFEFTHLYERAELARKEEALYLRFFTQEVKIVNFEFHAVTVPHLIGYLPIS